MKRVIIKLFNISREQMLKLGWTNTTPEGTITLDLKRGSDLYNMVGQMLSCGEIKCEVIRNYSFEGEVKCQ
ncbi:hypothetical protein NVP1084O_108 [Vibrio phage 1.084.O._10N.261.49.F5]|nr:hypothetical protein NVP1084O_108 [Vibrio phage 1.084.O._10N.261.49.F5]